MSQNFRESFPTEAEIQILMPGKVQSEPGHRLCRCDGAKSGYSFIILSGSNLAR